MSTCVNITIIGAGSAQFSGGIVRDLCVNPGLHGSRVTFMDVDERRLDNISRLAERLSSELNAGLTFSKTLDRRQALEGADFVINTAQVGGHGWTEAQRELGEKHGYYRGAHLHDFGQIALFLDVARDIEQICPNAWLIQSANPVFEGCTLMTRETRVKVLGLCHGHYGYREIAGVLGLDPKDVTAQMPGFNHFIWLTEFHYKGKDAYPLMTRETRVKVLGLCHGHYGYREIASVLGLDPKDVTAQMPGFNHFIWLTEFHYKGKDAYPLIDAWIRDSAETYWAEHRPAFYDNQMSRAAIDQYRLFGLLAIGDTPRLVDNPRLIGWWYHTDLETKKRWYGHLGGFDSEIGWNEYLEIMGENVQLVERAAFDETQPITTTFEAKQSEEQIVPIIHSLVNDQPGIYQVNIPNRGPVLPGFPQDLVVECQGVVDGSGIRGITVPPLPKLLVAGAMIPRWQRAEMVVEAIRSRDLNLVRLVLLYDPRTRSTEQADALIHDWLGEPRNQELADLFQFHRRGSG